MSRRPICLAFMWALTLGCLELPEAMAPPSEVEPVVPVPDLSPSEGPAPTPKLWVRSPAPGRAAPLNLRWLYLELQPAPVPMPPRVTLVSATATVEAEVEEGVGGGLLARLPPHRGPCRSLCPHTSYRLETDAVQLESIGAVETATAIDLTPPALTSTRALVVGDRLELDLFADEPIRARGDVQDRSGRSIPLQALPFVGPQLRARAVEELPADTDVWLTIFVEDAAGNPGPTLQLALRTPPRLEVRIQEVVTTPLHDWGDSEAGVGAPFDAAPGAGAVSSADEWVELINAGSAPIDLYSAALELRAIDGSPTITSLAGAPGLYFGSGGDKRHWWPQEALVVRTRGDMAQRELSLELWAARRQLDRWVVGGADADHPGGSPPDGVHEALSRTISGRVQWCVPTPGDPVPSSQCRSGP